MKLSEFLRAGDVLLYRPKGIFGRLISLKTWHRVGHCEGYVGKDPVTGEHFCVASRDGKGAGKYPLRTKELFKICRPIPPFDLPRAMEWFRQVDGEPYAWADLAAFIGVGGDSKGRVCSDFLASWQRAGGVNGFNGEPSRNIAPFQFDVSPTYMDFTVSDESDVTAEEFHVGA